MINSKEMTMLQAITESKIYNGANNPIWCDSPFTSERVFKSVCRSIEKKGLARFAGEGRKMVVAITESGLACIENVKPNEKVSRMKAINDQAIEFLTEVRDRAEKDGIRATKAVEMLVEKFPSITRSETYNSAVVVGINKLTARNTFDKIKSNG